MDLQIQTILEGKKSIALFAHQRPDGDALGSVLGLFHLLKTNTGASVQPHILDDIPDNLSFLPGFEGVANTYDASQGYDLLIILDTANLERSGLTEGDIAATETLVIDHHESNHQYGAHNIIHPDASSVAEMLAHIAKDADWKITSDAANCLLTGIYTDTGGFIHRSTSQSSFEMAAFLVSHGANHHWIAEKAFKSNSFEFQKSLGALLSRMNIYGDVNFCSMRGYEEEAGKDLKTVLVSMLNSIQGVRYACVLTQDGDDVRGSLRTNRDDINVSDMAANYGGGGHAKASGFNFPATLIRTDDGEDYLEIEGGKVTIEAFLKTLEV